MTRRRPPCEELEAERAEVIRQDRERAMNRAAHRLWNESGGLFGWPEDEYQHIGSQSKLAGGEQRLYRRKERQHQQRKEA